MPRPPWGLSPRPDRLLAPVEGLARLLAAAGLALDAYVHATLADQYDPVTATVSEGTLFRLEAALASLAALLVLLWCRFLTDAFAWLVAAGGLALLLVYHFVDIGAWGPFPDMYDPLWSSDKVRALVGEAVAVVALAYPLLRASGRGPRLAGGRARRSDVR